MRTSRAILTRRPRTRSGSANADREVRQVLRREEGRSWKSQARHGAGVRARQGRAGLLREEEQEQECEEGYWRLRRGDEVMDTAVDTTAGDSSCYPNTIPMPACNHVCPSCGRPLGY